MYLASKHRMVLLLYSALLENVLYVILFSHFARQTARPETDERCPKIIPLLHLNIIPDVLILVLRQQRKMVLLKLPTLLLVVPLFPPF
jgi:hypothetical protein